MPVVVIIAIAVCFAFFVVVIIIIVVVAVYVAFSSNCTLSFIDVCEHCLTYNECYAYYSVHSRFSGLQKFFFYHTICIHSSIAKRRQIKEEEIRTGKVFSVLRNLQQTSLRSSLTGSLMGYLIVIAL